MIHTTQYQQISVKPDGNCQYRAIALGITCNEDDYYLIKYDIINYIVEHRSFFNDYTDNIYNYINELRIDNEYGDEITLLAAAMNYDINIKVYDLDNNFISEYNKDGEEGLIELYFEDMHYDFRKTENVICDVNDYINMIIGEVANMIDWKELMETEHFPWEDEVFINTFSDYIFPDNEIEL